MMVVIAGNFKAGPYTNSGLLYVHMTTYITHFFMINLHIKYKLKIKIIFFTFMNYSRITKYKSFDILEWEER